MKKAVAETEVPACPDCGGPTEFGESSTEAMTLTFFCADSEEGGCGGEVEVRVKR